MIFLLFFSWQFYWNSEMDCGLFAVPMRVNII